MIDKSCIGEGATHNACSCFLEHMAKLETVAKAAEDAVNCPQFLCDDLDRSNLEIALAALREGKESK